MPILWLWPSTRSSCGIFHLKSYVSNQILKPFGFWNLRLGMFKLCYILMDVSCWSWLWTPYPGQYRFIFDPVHMAILQLQLKVFLGYNLTIKLSLKSLVDSCQGNSDGGSNTNSAGFQPLKRAWWIRVFTRILPPSGKGCFDTSETSASKEKAGTLFFLLLFDMLAIRKCMGFWTWRVKWTSTDKGEFLHETPWRHL